MRSSSGVEHRGDVARDLEQSSSVTPPARFVVVPPSRSMVIRSVQPAALGQPLEVDERDAVRRQDGRQGRANAPQIDSGFDLLSSSRSGVMEKKEPIPKLGIRLRGSA